MKIKWFVIFFIYGTIQSFGQFNPENGYTPGGIFDTVYDSRGNKYPLKALQINPGDNPDQLALPPPSASCQVGYFRLYFANNSGLDGPSSPDSDRRNVLCQLFSDISCFINTPLALPCGPSNSFVNIYVSNQAGNANGSAGYVLAFPPNPADPFPGIADGLVWQMLKTGNDPYNVIAPPIITTGANNFYHGIINVNTNITWNYNLGALPGINQTDMYTVFLHEAMHMLGINSQISSTGISVYGPTANYYSRYDLFLRNSANVALLSSTNAPCYNSSLQYVGGSAINPSGLIFNGNSDNTNCGTAVRYVGTPTVPVYTPNSFEPGSSLSHLEDLCYPSFTPSNNNQYFCMANAYGGTKRFPREEERLILCDLGYSLNSQYVTPALNGTYSYTSSGCNPPNIYGVNDGISGNSIIYTGNPTISIPIATIIANDSPNTVSISCVRLVYPVPGLSLYVGTNTITLQQSGPNPPCGINLIKYQPVNAQGQLGNVTYVYFYFPCINCNPPNLCNMIQNGGFESTTTPTLGINSLSGVSCWGDAIPDPDIFNRFAGNTNYTIPIVPNPTLTIDTWNGPPNNNKFAVTVSGAGPTFTSPNQPEVIKNNISFPLLPSNNYVLKLMVYNLKSGAFNFSSTPVVISVASTQNFGIFIPPGGPLYPTGLNILASFTLLPTSMNTWTNLTANVTFTPGINHNCILIGINPVKTTQAGNLTSNGIYGIYVDDVSLLPSSSSASFSPPSSICLGGSLNNLAQYASPIPGTFFGPGVTFSGGAYHFNAAPNNTLPPGSYPIAFTYTNSLGCTFTVPSVITLSNTPGPFTLNMNPSYCQNNTIPNLSVNITPTNYAVGGNFLGNGVTQFLPVPPQYSLNFNSVPLGLNSYTYNYPNVILSNTAVPGGTLSCTLSSTATVNVFPPITLSATASSTQICAGETTFLSATFMGTPSPGSFTWFPGAIGTPTNFALPVSPSVTTVFTVEASGGGCISSATINVNVLPNVPNFTTSLSEQFLCLTGGPGVITTLSVFPLGTYSIAIPPSNNLIAFTNSIILGPTVTANYTVYGSNINGCTANTVIPIYIVPCACIAAPGNTLSGLINPLSLPSNTIIKIVANATLDIGGLQNGIYGMTGNEIIVYPGVNVHVAAAPGGTFFLEQSYVHGCGDLWEGFKVPSIYNKFIVGTNNNSITTLIEDANTAIEVLNGEPPLVMVPEPDNILEVDKVTFNKNKVSIKIGSYKKNKNNYPFKIKRSLFTSRVIPVTFIPGSVPTWSNTDAVKNSSSGNSSTLQTPWINNTLFPPASITSTLYNYFNFPSNGIILDYVGKTLQPGGLGYQYKGISIGMNGPTNFNCFDNLQEDITAINTNLTITNSIFQNGRRFSIDPSTIDNLGGRGIVATGFVSDKTEEIEKYQINIINGAGNGNFNCKFYEKTIGADITNYFLTVIQYAEARSFLNDYSYFSEVNPFGNIAFNIRTNRYIDINLINNKTFNIKNAMSIGLDNLVTFGNTFREVGEIFINKNTVNRGANSVGPNPFVNVGLAINDPVAIATSTDQSSAVGITVIDNSFDQVFNGISILNESHSPTEISQNIITMVNEPPTPFFNPAPNQKGIFVAQLQKRISISSNSVSGQIGFGKGTEAISTALNASLAIRCNTTSYAGRGIEFNKPQTIEFFEDNHMSNETYGLVLDNSAKLTATTTPTNVIGSATRPTNNVWQNPWAIPGGFKTATFGNSSAQDGILYVQYLPTLDANGSGTTTGNTNPPLNVDLYFHTGFLGSITLLEGNLGTTGCRIGNNNGGGNGNGGGNNQNLSISMLERIASNGFSYQTNSIQNQTIDKILAHRILMGKPSLMSGSPILTNFYNTSQANNIGQTANIEESLANNMTNTAQSQISAFSPTNSVESNYKNYYEIYLSTKDSTYNGTDSLNLITLANMCPYIDGAVVFQARALYNIIYKGFYRFLDNCESLVQAREGKFFEDDQGETEVNVILKTSLFPNPNDGNYVLRINKFEKPDKSEKQSIEITIFDITGKEILKENRLLDDGDEVKMSQHLLNGTYLVKVKLHDGSSDIHRLIINK